MTSNIVQTLFICLGAALFAAGCAHLGASPEQIKAMEGVSGSLCVESPGWNGSPVKIHYGSFGGKSTGTAGGGGEATCGSSVLKFSNEGRIAKEPAK